MATYLDQFYLMDPGAPPAAGTSLSVVKLTMNDADNSGFITPYSADTVNGFAVTAVWEGDSITVELSDGSVVSITGTTFYVDIGGGAQAEYFTPRDGTVLEDSTFLSSTFVINSTQMDVGDLGPPCFTPGTLIAVPGGVRPVEALRAGDLVMTLDHGAQPVVALLSSTMAATGDHAPVRIAGGTFGNTRDLLVSPQHRMLVSGWQAELNYGAREVLIAARHLVNGTTITQAPQRQVTYVHLLMARHQIVFAEGALTESFHPGDAILSGSPRLRREVEAALSALGSADALALPTARPVVTRREAALLLAA